MSKDNGLAGALTALVLGSALFACFAGALLPPGKGHLLFEAMTKAFIGSMIVGGLLMFLALANS